MTAKPERAWKAAAIVLAIWLAAPAHAAGAGCGTQSLGGGTVRLVLDGRTLQLEDGRRVLLDALDIPSAPPNAQTAAQAYLTEHAVGRAVMLKGEAAPDRHGRIRAFVSLAPEGLEGSLQHAMLALGLARVAARAGKACTTELLARERQAREAKLGLWTEPQNAVQRADDPGAVQRLRGQLTLVEGRVLSVRESGGTIYVNFGRRWSEDFTVTVAKRNERTFAAAGLELKRLERATVRVRGWVEERGGPWIEVTRPEQIEVVRN
jgi:endonuclease YncB( thermonuclease family)